MLEFKPVTLQDRGMMESYFFRWGGHSCHYSFMSAFGTQGLFGDMMCEHDGFLYILRTKRCTDKERVYLFPSGDTADRNALCSAVMNVLDDAHSYSTSARFDTVNADAAEFVCEEFSGILSAEPSREYSEYIHRKSDLADYPGRKFESRRYDYNVFFRHYSGRAAVSLLQEEHIPAVTDFQAKWLAERKSQETPEVRKELDAENVGILRWLENFNALGLSGIAVFVDGIIRGYAFGAPMYDGYYDVLAEKGDSGIQDIYCVLVRELVRRCCGGCEYVNREEDCGHPGMRKAKLSYRPAFMLEKYTVRENHE